MDREQMLKKLLTIRLGAVPTKSVVDIISKSENCEKQIDYIEAEIKQAKKEAVIELYNDVVKKTNDMTYTHYDVASWRLLSEKYYEALKQESEV